MFEIFTIPEFWACLSVVSGVANAALGGKLYLADQLIKAIARGFKEFQEDGDLKKLDEKIVNEPKLKKEIKKIKD